MCFYVQDYTNESRIEFIYFFIFTAYRVASLTGPTGSWFKL